MASILLKEKVGYGQPREGKDPWDCDVFKGEFVVQIPQKEMRQIKGVIPNYRLLYCDPEVILYASPIDVVPLEKREIEYLRAVHPPRVRLKEFLYERGKKMKMDLIVGDKVVFKLENAPRTPNASVNGTIRYIGPHPDIDGIVFGIEIQDQAYHGQGTSNGRPYFSCGPNNAVFVAMDKIIKKQDGAPPTRSSQQLSVSFAEQPRPNTRSQTKPAAASSQPKGVYDRLRGFVKETVDATEDEKKLAEEFGMTVAEYRRQKQGYVAAVKQGKDDRKVPGDPKLGEEEGNEERFAAGGEMIRGRGRGEGPNELTDTLQAVQFAGPEAVHKRRIEIERRALEELMSKQRQRQQENHELQYRQHEDYEGGINESMVEDNYVHVSPYVSSYKQDNNGRGRRDNNQQQQPNLPAMAEGIRLQQPHQPQHSPRAQHLNNEGGGGRETASLSSLLNDDTRDHNSPHNDPSYRYDHNRDHHISGHQNHRNFDHGDPNRDQQGHDYYNRDKQDPNYGQQSYGHDQQSYNRGHQDWGHHDTAGHRDHYDPSHCPPDPSYPRDPHQGPPPGPPPDPHHQFTIGSMVRVDLQRGDPLYGVVQWIGTLPDYPETIAGMEMERTLRDGTDGTWHGTRFFTCPPGKGYFCPLNTLNQDTRYMDEGQVPAHMRLDIDNRSNKEEIIKLKEEIHQLQMSIENLQLEKDTQQKRAKQQAEREEQWKNEKQQLLEEQDRLRKEVKLVQEQLKTDKERLKKENGQLQYENEHLRRQNTDLREAHHELQQETQKKEQVQAQLQSQVGLFSIENMRLKGQVKQLEESSATDIKYWEVSYKQVLTNKDTLGSGGWGKVEVGLLHGQKVAVKMLHSDIKSPYYNQLVRREISMLAKVRHPNLLLFIAGVLDHPSGSPIIITELLDMSLRKAYTDRLIGSDRVRISIMRDVAAALNYIHRQKESIIHRDVSSANVLLESRGEGNWKAKLSDFGSANLVQFSTTVGPGAIPYAAPEVPHNQTTKMDVYSYGVLLCEVMLSEFPFKERFPDMLQSLAGSWSLIHQLILSCTRHSVADRVDMMYVLDTFSGSFTDVSVKGFVPLV